MGPPISQSSPTSPKPNPFSSLNPAPNPFMSYNNNKGLDYWNKIPKPISQQTHEPPKLFIPPPLFVQTSKNDHSNNNNNSNHNSNNKNNNNNENESNENDDNDNDEDAEDINNNNNNSSNNNEDNLENNDGLDSPGLLSPSYNVANGESDEECILQLRAKLFRFSKTEQKSEWIEIGIGPLRVLRPTIKVINEVNSETNKENIFQPSRLVMRRENTIRGVGKYFLNYIFFFIFSFFFSFITKFH